MSGLIRILFVCTGNICRSPTAEGVFRHLARDAGLEDKFLIASAGTDSYHIGEGPDARAVKIAKKNGVSIDLQRARALAETDYADFDYIFAMDGGHFYELQQRAPQGHGAKIDLFLSAAPHLHRTEVPDPWYGNEQDFADVYDLVYKGSKAILDKIKKEHGL